MFHALAACCAESFIGGPKKNRAWVQVYRFLEHGFASSKCEQVNVASGYPAEVEDFANCFVALLKKRYDADYNPKYRVSKLDVIEDIKTARDAIKSLQSVSSKHKKAFSTLVLLKSKSRQS